MVELLVIADDFTGALDTGVQFSKAGIKTFVTTNLNINPSLVDPDVKVLVVDTESRHIDHKKSYERVAGTAKNARNSGIKNVYKKTDSTLRGNVGSELTALMDTYGIKLFPFIPAYPEAGRTTVKGYHYVNSVLLQNTVFAEDPLEPMKDSYIPALIEKQTNVDTMVITTDIIADRKLSLPDNKTILIFDAESNSDFLKIGDFLINKGIKNITAGCAGFAAVLPQLLQIKSGILQQPKFDSSVMLVICGSVNAYSLAQVKHAERNGFDGITLTPRQKLDENYVDTDEGKEFINSILYKLARGKNIIIKNINDLSDVSECNSFAEKMGIDKGHIPALIAKNVATLAAEVINRSIVENLVVFGGDTAVAVMDKMQCSGIVPINEIFPGIPVSETNIKGRILKLITKAGGFGGEDALVKIRNYVKERCL
jgi:uncharacterized protein YgbK (DUF1537 family)